MTGINWGDKSTNIGHVISVRVDKESAEKIKEISKSYGIKQGSVVREIVRYYFKNIEKGDKL